MMKKYSFVKNLFTGREIWCAINGDLEKVFKTKENVIYVVQMEELYILVKVWWKSGQQFRSECHFCVFTFCPLAAILDIGPRPFSKGTFPFPPSIHHTNMKLIGQGILFKIDGNQMLTHHELWPLWPWKVGQFKKT